MTLCSTTGNELLEVWYYGDLLTVKGEPQSYIVDGSPAPGLVVARDPESDEEFVIFDGGLAWIFAGCIWCITIIGIPVGLQCFKFATLAFWPFGKEIVYGNGMFSFLVNLIWIIFFGWEMALGNLIVGCIWCITIVGIPFGKQFFKMARLSFMPFGASVIE